jgi:diaminohydroxyphosphoribosylaminopyrimidine deaminase/5-amino-6-(5-phosphoribosylamino)uracil reductase
MQRCFELAKLGRGNVAPNPMVGAVLVHGQRTIGEGYHMQYGLAHAEVNCISSVSQADRHLISASTLYVSLEPCAHFGKTPPCADLILRERIPVVVTACRDSFTEVDGRGLQKLAAAGVRTITPVCEAEARHLNRRFFTFHEQQRPYIVLKWAQTANRKIAHPDYSRLLISNEITNRKVHRWRSTEQAILVGTNTALHDDPALSLRLWPGRNPIRLVIDNTLKLPENLQLFDGTSPTIVFNYLRQDTTGAVQYYKINKEESVVRQVVTALFNLNIQSVLVEGGATLLQSFIDESLWDEAKVITNREMEIADGISAPNFGASLVTASEEILTDTIRYYKPA